MSSKVKATILLAATALIVSLPCIARADNVLRLYGTAQAIGAYTDNVHLAANNAQGDFFTNLVAGFYLDLTSPQRYTSLQWDTFAQLFVSHSNLDRAGQGQFARFTDFENLSHNTSAQIDEYFQRDGPADVAVASNDLAPNYSASFIQLLLAGDSAIINRFRAGLHHSFERNWTGDAAVSQETLSVDGNQSFLQILSLSSQYHFNETFSMGPGYNFYDFRFTAPGVPGNEVHWPYLRVGWSPIKNLTAEGRVGPVFGYTFGTDKQTVDVAGVAEVTYTFRRGMFEIYGGQEPSLTAGLAGAGSSKTGRGEFTYDLTRRLSFHAGTSYYDITGRGVSAQIWTYGGGFNEQVRPWMVVYARYVGLQSNINAPSPVFVPTGIALGAPVTANYFLIGVNLAVQLHHWSWL